MSVLARDRMRSRACYCSRMLVSVGYPWVMLSCMAGSMLLIGIAKDLSLTTNWLILSTITTRATKAYNC